MSKETESKLNEYQEALEIVDESACESLSRKYLKKHYTLLKELVDKVTPKKPKEELTPYGHLIFAKYSCPTCGTSMGHGNCCSNNDCRQAIDWSTDEKN